MAFATLKKRREFLTVRGGRRWSAPAFLLEGRQRKSECSAAVSPLSSATSPIAAASGPRFGFTVTKKMGNAVARNRIRRRLRAAIADLAPELADPTFDYVVLARRPALDCSFEQLRMDLRTAFERIHKPASRRRNRPRGVDP